MPPGIGCDTARSRRNHQEHEILLGVCDTSVPRSRPYRYAPAKPVGVAMPLEAPMPLGTRDTAACDIARSMSLWREDHATRLGRVISMPLGAPFPMNCLGPTELD